VLLDAIARGLAARGHEVHLLVYAHGAFPVDAPYRIHRLPDHPRFRSLRSGPDWRRVALDLVLAFELRRRVRELRPDLLHLHNVEAGAAALLLPDRPDVPCVYHAHNLMQHELPTYEAWLPPPVARRLGRLLDRELPARADLTLAVSEPTRAGLLALGLPPEHLVTVEPGVDLDELAAPPAPPPCPFFPSGRREPRSPEALRVAHLGNLDRYQGVDRVLDALAVLRRSGWPAELVAISDSDPAWVRRLADRLHVPASFVPHGSLAGAIDVARSCHVAALARDVPGGFPIKLIALLHAGLPVAATRSAVDGLRVDPVVWVADREGANGLADAILSAATHLRAELRSAAGMRLAAERFSAAAAAERLEAALRTLVG
jgi:glycosyltransferase involved in cell wall biosynthesis